MPRHLVIRDVRLYRLRRAINAVAATVFLGHEFFDSGVLAAVGPPRVDVVFQDRDVGLVGDTPAGKANRTESELQSIPSTVRQRCVTKWVNTHRVREKNTSHL